MSNNESKMDNVAKKEWLFWSILDFDFKWKLEDLKNKFLELFWIGKKTTEDLNKLKDDVKKDKEKSEDELNLEKLKSFFDKNATNLSVELLDGDKFFEVSYIDKNSGSKVKGIIPLKWNGDSNIYMPGDRSGIDETMNQKSFKKNILWKWSKKARFIFEWDSDKIKDWTDKSKRYNNVIANFENMISPMKSAGTNPKINIIWHSRAWSTVNQLLESSNSISSYIIIDGTYWTYNNVINSKIPGKIYYTNGGGTKWFANKYKNIIGTYTNSGHEQIVSQVLFDDPTTNQDLFA